MTPSRAAKYLPALLAILLAFFLPGIAKGQLAPVSSSVSVSAVIPAATGNLRLIGDAAPNSLVTFLRNGSVIATTVADSNSHFDKTLTSLDPGVHTFSLYGVDGSGQTTLTLSFDVNIISGTTITLSGFLLPSTISLAKPILKRPDKQVAAGTARNDATVTVFFNSDPITKQTSTNINGGWEVKVDEVFGLGSHTASAIVQDSSGNQSLLSPTLPFTVVLSADLNLDTRVNLTDFSILMFSYGSKIGPNKAADINDNGPVDLIDFSIMMFHWTGG